MIPGEHIAAYLDLLGQSVTVAGSTVLGVLDEEYGEAFGVGSASPVLTCASADVSTVTQGAAVTVGAVSYTVRAIEPDGQGVTVLRLHKS